jgi:hypothetical protein
MPPLSASALTFHPPARPTSSTVFRRLKNRGEIIHGLVETQLTSFPP